MSDVAYVRPQARPDVPPHRAAPGAIAIGGVVGALLFVMGIGVGVLVQTVVNPGPPANPYGEVPPVPEPPAATGVAQLLVNNDAVGLARVLDAALLERLAQAIDPLVDIDKMEFTRAVERQGDILASYVASGRMASGDKFIVGVVFRVREGQVVGVN